MFQMAVEYYNRQQFSKDLSLSFYYDYIYIQRFDYSGFVHKFKLLSQRNFVDKLSHIFGQSVALNLYNK